MTKRIPLIDAAALATELAGRMNGTDPKRQLMAYSFETYYAIATEKGISQEMVDGDDANLMYFAGLEKGVIIGWGNNVVIVAQDELLPA